MSLKKLFTEKQVSIAAFLGGPIPPGILIYKNLIRMNKEKEAYITLAGTLIFSILLVYGLLAIPDDIFNKVPSQLLPSLLGLMVWALYHFLMAKETKEALGTGDIRESNWKVAGITLAGTLLYLSMVVVIALTEPPFPGEKLAFGENEIYYDENTSEADVRKLADHLFNIEYFSDEYPNAVLLETWPTKHAVTLPMAMEFWEDQEIMAVLQDFKLLLQVEFNTEVTVILEHWELNGKRNTKSF